MNRIQMIKEVRERTGAGLFEAKNAVEESNLNIGLALEILRKNNSKYKDHGRLNSSEGRIGSAITKDGKTAVMVEVNCSTDFAANTYEFEAMTRHICKLGLKDSISDILDLQNDPDVKKQVEQSQRALKETVFITRFTKWHI